MKKTIVLMMTGLMALGALTSCGKKEEPTASAAAIPPPVAASSSIVVAAEPSLHDMYKDEPIIGTWYDNEITDLFNRIVTFNSDGTQEIITFDKKEKDYPEEYDSRLETYELTTYLDRPVVKRTNSISEVEYWEITAGENGEKFLRLWVEDNNGEVKNGYEEIYSNIDPFTKQ